MSFGTTVEAETIVNASLTFYCSEMVGVYLHGFRSWKVCRWCGRQRLHSGLIQSTGGETLRDANGTLNEVL